MGGSGEEGGRLLRAVHEQGALVEVTALAALRVAHAIEDALGHVLEREAGALEAGGALGVPLGLEGPALLAVGGPLLDVQAVVDVDERVLLRVRGAVAAV